MIWLHCLPSLFKMENQALSYSEKALAFFGDQALVNWEDSLLKGDFLISRGTAYMRLDSIAKALTHYQQALSLKLPYQPYIPSQIATIYNNMAVAHIFGHSAKDAIPLLTKSIQLNLKDENDPELAGNYDNLGEAWIQLGNYHNALHALNRAISYFGPLIPVKDSLRTPYWKHTHIFHPSGYLSSMSLRAKTLLKLYQHNKDRPAYLYAAYASYQTLDTLIQSLRLQYQVEGSKESLVSLAKPAYEFAIQSCMELYDLTHESNYQQTAFEYAEKSKSMILFDALQHSQAIRHTLKAVDREKLLSLTSLRVYYEKSWHRFNTTSSPLASQQISVEDSVIKYRKLEFDFLNDLKHQRPEFYYSLSKTGIIQLSELRNEILQDQSKGLIEFFVGDSNLYTFLITIDTFVIHHAPLDFDLDGSVYDLREAIILQKDSDSLDQIYSPILHDLAYQMFERLLKPFDDQKLLPRRLIVIRDDVLGLLPFEVLLTKKAENRLDFPRFNYLIKERAISYAFSASLLRGFMRNKIQPRKRLIAFAPMQFQLVQKNHADLLSSILTDLFRSDDEVDLIASHGDEEKFFQQLATLKNFKTHAEQFWIIYLASHSGILDQTNPRSNGIAFHDSILVMADLYQMQLNAELVILRACETAIGEIIPGEGIASLANGFAHTGAKSVFSTQWIVPQASYFMQVFMELLYDGQPKDEALRFAKLDQITDIYPYYWAAYEIHGDVSPASFEPSIIYLISIPGIVQFVLLLGMIGLVSFLVVKNRKKLYRQN